MPRGRGDRHAVDAALLARVRGGTTGAAGSRAGRYDGRVTSDDSISVEAASGDACAGEAPRANSSSGAEASSQGEGEMSGCGGRVACGVLMTVVALLYLCVWMLLWRYDLGEEALRGRARFIGAPIMFLLGWVPLVLRLLAWPLRFVFSLRAPDVGWGSVGWFAALTVPFLVTALVVGGVAWRGYSYAAPALADSRSGPVRYESVSCAGMYRAVKHTNDDAGDIEYVSMTLTSPDGLDLPVRVASAEFDRRLRAHDEPYVSLDELCRTPGTLTSAEVYPRTGILASLGA